MWRLAINHNSGSMCNQPILNGEEEEGRLPVFWTLTSASFTYAHSYAGHVQCISLAQKILCIRGGILNISIQVGSLTSPTWRGLVLRRSEVVQAEKKAKWVC